MFSWSIDHAVFMAQIESWWAMINTNGIAGAVITLISGAGIVLVFMDLFKNGGNTARDD